MTSAEWQGNDTGGDLPAIWGAIQGSLRREFGERTFESWLKHVSFVQLDGDTVVLALPTCFMCEWIRNHFLERLRSHWVSRLPRARAVSLVVQSVLEGSPEPAPRPQPVAQTVESSMAVPLESRFTFDSFVVGKSNELAYNAARTLAEGGPISFNPLFLHGTTGLGKTHLMHAIGWEVRMREPTARIAYMSAEKFMLDFLAALRAKDTISFKQRLRSVELLMIDDVQFIAGKDSTQEEFFHTVNEIISAGHRLVLTADRSPQNLEGIQDRILSRMTWGLVADINPADYELRLNILAAKRQNLIDVAVPDEVIDFLARRITSNVRELEGALNRVAAHAAFSDRGVDIEFARQVLSELLRAHDRKVTIDEIQRRVTDYYAVKLSDLLSARRAREIARPRQIAMFLAKRLTSRSLPEIGRRFGGRDHTTVIHAVKRIEELRLTDSELDGDLTRLQALLEA